MWPGYFLFNGTEVINTTRTEAYADHARAPWFKAVYKAEDLAWLLGDGNYSTPLQDDAPWTDPDRLDSYDFWGVYPLEVVGFEDSTIEATVVESVIDGGYVQKPRRKTRTTVFSAVLVGASECAVEYGMRWLRSVLTVQNCNSASYGVCGGGEVCYLGCEPTIAEVDPTFTKGDPVLTDTNLAVNAGVESGVSGWASGDAAKYEVISDTVAPISGERSAVSTRKADTVVATNLATNPNVEAGINGWSSNTPARYPIAASTTLPISGTQSAMVTRTADTPNTYLFSGLVRRYDLSRFPCTPGRPITYAYDLKVEQANRRGQTTVTWYNAAGTQLSTAAWQSIPTLPATGVTRVVRTLTPPADAASFFISVEIITVSGNTLEGERCWFDNLTVEQDPTSGAYYDGSTSDTADADYRWTGTANASTSEKMGVGSPLASSLRLSDAGDPFDCQPGVPITVGIDVKVEQGNRQVSGHLAWTGGGTTSTVTVAGVVGSVVRLVLTGTPPAGVTSVVPVVEVSASSGNAVVGERVWHDNLYVGGDPSGTYYDGDFKPGGPYTYGWSGTEGASTSLRYQATYTPNPVETAEQCYDRIGRSMHDVTTTVGPVVTQKMDMNDGGCAWSVTWTMVAANPAEFGMEKPIVVGFLDPAIEIPYADGIIPPGGIYDTDGNVTDDPVCPVAVYTPVYDPMCDLLSPPPDVPTVVPDCFDFPVNFRRFYFTLPAEFIPLWDQVVPVIKLSTRTVEARNIRLRFYADTFGTANPDSDPCNYCGDIVISYVPPSSTLVIDGADHDIYLDSAGIGRRRADALATDSTGKPMDWPEFSCGFGYVVTVDMPQQQAERPIVDFALVSRIA